MYKTLLVRQDVVLSPLSSIAWCYQVPHETINTSYNGIYIVLARIEPSYLLLPRYEDIRT